MSETLKPCPFCGSSNLCNGHGSKIFCFDCGAEGPTARWQRGIGSPVVERAKQWNRRTTPTADPPRTPMGGEGETEKAAGSQPSLHLPAERKGTT